MQTTSLLEHRILFLSGPVETDVANQLVSSLLLLDADNHDAPIDFYINSPGGSLVDSMAIIDTMQCIQAAVRTICVGQASSAAAFVLAAGSRGTRAATPNAQVMIHQVNADIQGSAVDMQVQAQRVIKLQDNMLEMLVCWTGQHKERLEKDMDRDFYLSATEAKDYGLIDQVLEPYSK